MKVGVGRKISYDIKIEEQLLLFVMVEREQDKGLTFKELKDKAVSLVRGSKKTMERFQASHSWARKFCIRNELDIEDPFVKPKYFPK